MILFLAGTVVQANHIILRGEAVTPNIMRIPFDLNGGLIIVEAAVNDTMKGKFIFDTGASTLVLNSKYFEPERYATAMSAGVTGSAGAAGLRSLKSFTFDNLITEKVEADVISLTHIERKKKFRLMGLIGYEMVRGFEIIFDYDMLQLVLIRLDKDGNRIEEMPEDEYEVEAEHEIRVKDYIAIVKLKFDDKLLSFGLDSGAEVNLIDHLTPAKRLKAHFAVSKRVKLNGSGAESIEVLYGNLFDLRYEEVTLDSMPCLVTDLTSVNNIYGTQLDGIAGYEFLRQFPCSLNYKKKKLTIFKKED